MRGRVLVVDNQPEILAAVASRLRSTGFEVRTVESALSGLSALEALRGAFDVVLIDNAMPEMEGIEFLTKCRQHWPGVAVVMMAGQSDVHSAVEAMRCGAYDYLVKGSARFEELPSVTERALERKRLVERNQFLERQMDPATRLEGIVGDAPAIREVFGLIESVAPTDATVLLLGESGTGKELVARAIHQASTRSERSFIAVNCSALAETLLESELFGHVRGSFTGAVADRRGVFEEASGGTLFLDEVGDVGRATQLSLLRTLQDGEIKPVGSSETQRVDCRVVAATNRDLPRAIQEGAFREDLYYRLNVVSIELPPLRDRPDDIPKLVHHFMRKHEKRMGKSIVRVDPEAMEALIQYQWPGNVRELENAVQRAIVLAKIDALTLDGLPALVRAKGNSSGSSNRKFELGFAEAKRAAVNAFERGYVEDALGRAKGSVAEASRIAGLDRSNFRRLMKRHRLESGRFRMT